MQHITKSTTVLVDDHYRGASTSLLVFHFEPQMPLLSDDRLQRCVGGHTAIDGKDLYVVDGFFSQTEEVEMQRFSSAATFSRSSYGSPEAIEKGEKPALSMNGRERWQFFSKPPAAIGALYKLFGMCAHQLRADVTTLPWELCDSAAHSSPAVVVNRIEEASEASMELGKHQDCNPEQCISFGIPVLYAQEATLHARRFINGSVGKPWMISVMLYVADRQFRSEYGMGTVFYQHDGAIAVRTNCVPMRLVVFEGDLFHSIEASTLPEGLKTWRVSYVFKLVVNPRENAQCVKDAFRQWIHGALQSVHRPALGSGARM